MSSHALPTLIELTSLLSAYRVCAIEEEDAAAALHQASVDLERAIQNGSEKATCDPFSHPTLVAARCKWRQRSTLEAHAFRAWEEMLNIHLRRNHEHRIEVQIHEGRYVPMEYLNGGWIQLRSFERPDTEFATRQQAVLWLHHQMTERQLEVDALIGLWTAPDEPPQQTA